MKAECVEQAAAAVARMLAGRNVAKVVVRAAWDSTPEAIFSIPKIDKIGNRVGASCVGRPTRVWPCGHPSGAFSRRDFSPYLPSCRNLAHQNHSHDADSDVYDADSACSYDS